MRGGSRGVILDRYIAAGLGDGEIDEGIVFATLFVALQMVLDALPTVSLGATADNMVAAVNAAHPRVIKPFAFG